MEAAPDTASSLRELADRIASVADDLGAETSRSDLDAIAAQLRLLIVRQFGRKPRATRGAGALHAILAYLQTTVGEWVEGEELAAVSGIQEWGRRVRELRVEHGYEIGERDDRYKLRRMAPGTSLTIEEIEDVQFFAQSLRT